MTYTHVVNENIERVSKGKYKTYDEYQKSMKKRCTVLNVMAVLSAVIVMLTVFFNYVSYFDGFVYGVGFSVMSGAVIVVWGICMVVEWSGNMDKSVIHQECCVDNVVLVDIYKTIEYYVGKVPHTYTPTIEQMHELNAYYMRLTNLRELGLPSVLIKK